MRMGVTEMEELQTLRRCLPDLFCRPGRHMLYVGANQIRPPHHVLTFIWAGWHMHLLEIFPSNIEHQRRMGLFETYLHGDVRTATLPATFDVTLWWHGCEHIQPQALGLTLSRLEASAPLVVLGCPHGVSPQDTVYGNEAERHQWSVYPADLEQYGYQVHAYDCVGRHHLLAWKGTP